MKKISLSLLALWAGMLTTHAQSQADSSHYVARTLHLDEINFVSGYYHQEGNNSAVTGGIGTEKLTDFANTINIQVSKLNAAGFKHTFQFELGIDHYTSASSDKIDPHTISSASAADTRIYPSLHWTRSNEKTGNALGVSASLSSEFDYQSRGIGFNLTRLSKDKNRQFDFKAQAFFDTWKVILPIELRPSGNEKGPYDNKPRDSYSASFSLSQVINTRLQALIVAEPSYQHGLLATRYQRNYFTDGSERAENLPGSRYKLPIGIRFSYFLDDHFIVRAFYRYYMDNWGIRAHTAEIEVPVKFTPFFSLSPFYRYNTQQGTRYFKPYGQHDPAATYYTSDYDLSSLHSDFAGANLRLSPPKGVLGYQHFNSMELRYGHYLRSTGLTSNIVTLALKFK